MGTRSSSAQPSPPQASRPLAVSPQPGNNPSLTGSGLRVWPQSGSAPGPSPTTAGQQQQLQQQGREGLPPPALSPPLPPTGLLAAAAGQQGQPGAAEAQPGGASGGGPSQAPVAPNGGGAQAWDSRRGPAQARAAAASGGSSLPSRVGGAPLRPSVVPALTSALAWSYSDPHSDKHGVRIMLECLRCVCAGRVGWEGQPACGRCAP